MSDWINHSLDTKRDRNAPTTILVVTLFLLGLPVAELFAKGQTSGSHASGTGSKSWRPTPRSQIKSKVVNGNYNPNTGKRSKRISNQ
jgi:hypothetical protein